MSNNDLWCSKCKSQHHPADCPMDEEVMNKAQAHVDHVKELREEWEDRDERSVDDVTRDLYFDGFDDGYNNTSCRRVKGEKDAKAELYNIIVRELEREKCRTKRTMGGIACDGKYVNWEDTDPRAIGHNEGIDQDIAVIGRLMGVKDEDNNS